jgi:hypothetical protein
MTSVRFAEASQLAGSSLTALAPLLGRVLFSKHGTSDPQQVIRAMICSAIGSGHPAAAVRHYIQAMPRAAHLVSLTGQDSWYPLVASAKAYMKLVNDADGGARAKRLPWARIGTARLVSPLPADADISTRLEARIRITMAVLMARALETGFDTLLATSGWLALEINTTPVQAAKVLKTMARLRWIRRVRGSGMGIRYRFCFLDTGDLREAAWSYNLTVDALANNRPEEDPLALLISMVRSPAWAYSEELGHRAWLRLAITLMPTVDTHLGLSRLSYRKLGKALDTELPGALTGDIDLPAALGLYAEESLAVFIYEDRGTDLAAAAKENLVRLHDVRAVSNQKFADIKAAQQILRDAWKRVGRVPDAVEPGEAIKRWVDDAAAYFVGNPVEPEMLEPVQDQLRGVLDQRGHDESLINRIGAYVLPEPASI